MNWLHRSRPFSNADCYRGDDATEQCVARRAADLALPEVKVTRGGRVNAAVLSWGKLWLESKFDSPVLVVKNHLEENEEKVKDPKILKKIYSKRKTLKDAFDPELAFTQFIEDGSDVATSLVKTLKPGGWVDLAFDEDKGVLYGVTEYQSTRKLSAKELSFLAEYTLGQWSDGGGTSIMDDFSTEIEPYYVDLFPFEVKGRLKGEQL